MSNADRHSAVISLREARVETRPPVVFLHGLFGVPEGWRSVADELEHKGALYAETLAGHGATPRYHASFISTVDAIADRWADKPAHFVGYSLGGRLALALAALRPASVLSVVAIGAHPGLIDETERLRRQRWEMELCDVSVHQGLEALINQWEKLPLWESQRALPPEALQRQRRARLSHTRPGVAWALQSLGTGAMPELWSGLQDTKVPIALVAGALDEKFASINDQVAALSDSITKALVPDVGHNVVLEAPVSLAMLIRAHLVRSNLASARASLTTCMPSGEVPTQEFPDER